MSQTRFKLTAKTGMIDLTINIFTSLRTLSIWSMYQIFSGENLKHKKEKVNLWNIAEKVVLDDNDLRSHSILLNVTIWLTLHPAFDGEEKTKAVKHDMVQVKKIIWEDFRTVKNQYNAV